MYNETNFLSRATFREKSNPTGKHLRNIMETYFSDTQMIIDCFGSTACKTVVAMWIVSFSHELSLCRAPLLPPLFSLSLLDKLKQLELMTVVK